MYYYVYFVWWLAATVRFTSGGRIYKKNDMNGPQLTISPPLSFPVTVTVSETDGTAIGKSWIECVWNNFPTKNVTMYVCIHVFVLFNYLLRKMTSNTCM